VRIEPAGRVAGTLTPPPDKSISHRAALLGAMCERPVRIRNYLRAADTASTLAALCELGVEVHEHEPRGAGSDLLVEGVGLRGAREASGSINVGNAGTLLRMLPGWLAGQGRGRWTVDGDESIRRRPVDRVAEPLRLMGAAVDCRDGRLPPIIVEGSELAGIRYELPVASAQVKSCVLLAGLLAEGETAVVERLPSRDHTELMLELAGAPLTIERAEPSGPATVTIETVARLELEELVVPGDLSSAAFFIVAATILPGSEVTLKGVGVNHTRTGLLEVMRRMGANVELSPVEGDGGEPAADLGVRHAHLRGTTVVPAEVPLLIDELPLVALLGVFAEGTTTVAGAGELRHKESDRIATVVEGLRALGGRIEPTADGFTVEGTGGLPGGQMQTGGDHRLAMLGAVAGLASRAGAEVHGFDAAAVSYPGFAADLTTVVHRSDTAGER
jgi:3-phosphoshikimate 1-carboxyvinyltransferase